jgi:hypothetical protein
MGLLCRIVFFRPRYCAVSREHSCAKTASRPVARACDVSRETVFSDSAPLTRTAGAAMFRVKHFCVIPPREFVSPNPQSYIPAPAPTRKIAS